MNKELLNKLKKASSVDSVEVLKNSRFFGDDEFITSDYPILNLALSGKIDGGLSRGLTIFAGPSKHFKSSYMCILMAAFLNAKPNGLVVFYDSEFGSKPSYFSNFGVDTERVLHIPVMNVEELKFDVMKKLEEVSKEDDIMISIDSIGNLASKKEIQDALDESSAADMTRAKQLKSFGRMITPYLTIKDIPMVAINHTYSTMEMFSQQVMSGGTGLQYSSDSVIFVNRVQNKEDKEIVGYNFDLTIMKSRFVKEQSRLPISVSYEHGVSKYSGLFGYALEYGYITSPSKGWYNINYNAGFDGQKVRKSNILENEEMFLKPLLQNKEFVDKLESRYRL